MHLLQNIAINSKIQLLFECFILRIHVIYCYQSHTMSAMEKYPMLLQCYHLILALPRWGRLDFKEGYHMQERISRSGYSGVKHIQ